MESLPTFTSDRIFLVGMMGSGKSHIGKLLSKQLGFSFRDTDQIVEDLHGSIGMIFEKEGEQAFRKYELEALKSVIHERRVVISTGGGLPINDHGMDTILACGSVVYLQCSLDTLASRLDSERSHRPLIAIGQLQESLESLLDSRESTYLRSHLVVNADGSVSEIIDDILDGWERSSPNPPIR